MRETLVIDPAVEPLLRANGLGDFESWFTWNTGERLSKAKLPSWRQRWRIALRDEQGETHTFDLKRFVNPPFRERLRRRLEGSSRLSTAGMEAQNARELREAGVSATRVAACGEQMQGGRELRSFILLAEVPGESLEKWVPRELPPVQRETDPQLRRARLDALARLIARLHTAGFVHRDLYLSHVFINVNDEPDNTYTLIDLQRVFTPVPWRRRRWVIKDLAALDASTPTDRVGVRERLRFLARYVRQCPHFGTAHALAARIAARNG